MKKPKIFAGILVFPTLILFAQSANAKVTFQNDFAGTVMISSPDGKMNIVEPGEPIPEIPPNSTVEVFNGHATFNADAADNLKLTCLGHDMTVKTAAQATLKCEESSGLLQVAKGSVNLVDPAGKGLIIGEGKEYRFQAEAAKYNAPTEAVPTVGGAPAGGNLGAEPPVDSRSVESSPSR